MFVNFITIPGPFLAYIAQHNLILLNFIFHYFNDLILNKTHFNFIVILEM